MRVDQEAVRLFVFLTDEDHCGHRRLHNVLLERARDSGIAGGTLWRGLEGYGRSGVVRSNRFVDSTLGLPLALEFIDSEEKIESFLPVLAELAPGSLVTRETVHMSRARPGDPGTGVDDPPS